MQKDNTDGYNTNYSVIHDCTYNYSALSLSSILHQIKWSSTTYLILYLFHNKIMRFCLIWCQLTLQALFTILGKFQSTIGTLSILFITYYWYTHQYATLYQQNYIYRLMPLSKITHINLQLGYINLHCHYLWLNSSILFNASSAIPYYRRILQDEGELLQDTLFYGGLHEKGVQ